MGGKHPQPINVNSLLNKIKINFNFFRLNILVAQPIFGVSLGLAVVRSHCHDNVNLPLVVRDCIDYLQEHGLQSEQIYKVDMLKTKLQQLKRVYNNRETAIATDFDIPTACSLLKVFIRYKNLKIRHLKTI